MAKTIDWFFDSGAWFVMLAAIIVIAILTTPTDHDQPCKFSPGQEVRLKASGGKAVVVGPSFGGHYSVRHSDHQGELHTIDVVEAELVEWPSSFQSPKRP